MFRVLRVIKIGLGLRGDTATGGPSELQAVGLSGAGGPQVQVRVRVQVQLQTKYLGNV